MAAHAGPAPRPIALPRLLPAERWLTDEASLALHGCDIFAPGEVPAAVALPETVAEVQAIVREAAARRIPLTVRGGGASYTGGYTHARPGGILLATDRLTRILAIDTRDAFVTVEPGVTWAALDAALRPLGWRTPFRGPFSGLHATVGGAMSQHAISHGTGRAGISAESLLSLELVTGTGELLATGTAASASAHPFFRHDGPDLAGLFTGDCGAFGIKVRLTLRIERAAPHAAFLSARFDAFAAMADTMAEVSAERLDDTHFGIDAAIQRAQIERGLGIGGRLGVAKAVLQRSDGLVAGAASLVRMASDGVRDLMLAPYAVHWIVEGQTAAEARGRADRIRALLRGRGTELPPTVAEVTRATPFPPFTSILSMAGERWVPIHAILPISRAAGFHAALQQLWRERRAMLDRHGIHSGTMFMCPRPGALLYEPSFNWPDAQLPPHAHFVPPAHRARLPTHPPNDPAREAVEALRCEVIDLMQKFGAAHFQIGRTYPFVQGRNPATLALVRALKATLDPHGILAPGQLGL